MNVAEDVRDAFLVEVYVSAPAGFVQAQVETLAVKERKHIVKERVGIWERHDRANRDDKQMW